MSEAQVDPLKRAILALRETRSRLEELESAAREPIAVIGIGCRFPGGASDPEIFFEKLVAGFDAVGRVPPDRWDAERSPSPWGAFLDGIDRFDPEVFGIAPREAEAMDPQQRLLLEVAWEALEHAGLAPDRLAGSATGVYVGINGADYLELGLADADRIDAYVLSGGVASIAAGRLSYVFGLSGPSLALDTACSSSLAAIHVACQALRAGEIERGIVGGVFVGLRPQLGIALSKLHMLAPDGRCKTFDAAADGFVQGEGCGVVVLERLAGALRDGHRPIAVIRGSAMNQDGRSGGLTAPSGPAQRAVIHAALERSGIEPGRVGYVEAHGTGTALGDPIEVHALVEALGEGRGGEPLALGSVKTNIGHLGPAAGIAGLIKVVLSLSHGTIPPSLNFREWNPHIAPGAFPLVVPAVARPWTPIGPTRIAGVSSFGFSGTNVHVVLEEAPDLPLPPAPPGRPRGAHVLCLAAADPAALRALARRTRDYLARSRDALGDACYTAAIGRARFPYRRALVASDLADLAAQLEQVESGSRAGARKVALFFPGSIEGWLALADELRSSEPAFAEALDRVESAFLEARGESLRPDVHRGESLISFELALAEVLSRWSVRPFAVLGQGVGELAAAAHAGALDPREAFLILARPDAPARRPTPRQPSVPVVPAGSSGGGFARLAELGCDLLVELGAHAREEHRLEAIATLPLAACLGALWERGVEIDWASYYRGRRVARVTLPTYPFQRRRLWRDFEARSSAPGGSWPGTRRALATGETVFELDVDLERFPYLDDHRVGGRGIVPGAFHLALLLDAHRAAGGPDHLVLERVAFVRPLALEPGTRVLVQAILGVGRPSRVFSREGEGPWREHVSTLVRPGTPLSTVPLDSNTCHGRTISAEDWARSLARRGVAIGPAFQGIASMTLGRGEALAFLVPEAAGGAPGTRIHPARLDACLQAAGGAAPPGDPDDAFLPLEIESFEAGPRLAGVAQVRAVARAGADAASFATDLALFDGEGLLVGNVRGLEARRVTRDSLSRALDDRSPHDAYRVEWLERPLGPGGERSGRRWLAGEDGPFARELEAALGGEIRRLVPGLPGSEPLPDDIVFLAGLEGARDVPERESALAGALLSILRFAHERGVPCRVWIVTRGVLQGASEPAGAALWGLGLTAALEAPHLAIRLVDLDGERPVPESLAQEIRAAGPEDRVTIHAGRRRVARLVPWRLPDGPARPPRVRDTILITGGLGGLGLRMARWAVERGASCVVLAGRSAPSPEARSLVSGLERQGAVVRAIRADVGLRGDVRSVFAQMGDLPPLRGIVHAAGVPGRGLLLESGPGELAETLSPRLGAWWLHEETLERDLDFFLLFSSVASIWGAAGQSGYAAGNSFLDALASHRRAAGLPAVSIRWGRWGGIGMASRLEPATLERVRSLGLDAMDADRAVLLLERALETDVPDPVLASVDWARFATKRAGGALPPFFEHVAHAPRPAEPSMPSLLDRWRTTPADRKRTWLEAELANLARQVLGVEPERNLAADRPLLEMGLDSLMAVELRHRIARAVGVPVSLAALLKGASVGDLTDLVEEGLRSGEDWEVLAI